MIVGIQKRLGRCVNTVAPSLTTQGVAMTDLRPTHPRDRSLVPAFRDPQAVRLLDRVEAVIVATELDSWWTGPTFRSPCGTKHCVLSHVADQLGMDVMEEFENTWSTSYVIGAVVNDKPSEDYPQPHPKDRVLAFLADLRSGDQLDTQSSMAACMAWSDTQ